jgi:hypothetical protein
MPILLFSQQEHISFNQAIKPKELSSLCANCVHCVQNGITQKRKGRGGTG